MERLPIPLISVQGTPADMGTEYGSRAAGLVAGNLDDYLRRFRDQLGLDLAGVERTGSGYRRLTAEYNPRVAAMLDGVADGAGISREQIFALNARTEILYGAGSPETGADDGCTSIAVLPRHTATGHTLLGQNWDWHPEQRAFSLLLLTRDERDFAVLTLAEAGMLAKSGVNSAGLGVCANLLVCDRDGTPGGVPYHVLLRGALESDAMATALRAICPAPRSASGNFLIADAGGEAIDLETYPGDFGYLVPENGLLAHSNHFLTPVPVRDERRAMSALSLLRPTRVRHLLTDALADRKVTEEDVQEVFRDHYSFPNAICRHVDERDPVSERVCSVFSILIDLDERRFTIADGPPCEHEYLPVPLG